MTAIRYLKLVRAPAGFTAISNILGASVIMANGQLSPDLAYLIAASVCFYFAGMALNDCFDVKEDTAERPSRPIPSGDISLGLAWILGLGLMAVGLLFAFMFSTVSGVIGLALSTAIIGYNGFVKEGLLGSFCMALCRYLNWLLGASFIALSVQSFLIALPILAYITGLTYLSKQETNAENKNAVWGCAIALVVAIVSCIFLMAYVFPLKGLELWFSCGLLLISAGLMLNKLRLVFLSFSPQSIQQMIIFMVIGVIPFDALLVALSGHYVWAALIFVLLVPCRILNKRLNAIT